ncbi:Spc98 family-domain-containing protein [Lipomyces arxii]|uniref:Spc98 family-domain-containing protein n=1 Tax=Lipomyces arxii TaxID=56418 RepID=UPI0034CF28AF
MSSNLGEPNGSTDNFSDLLVSAVSGMTLQTKAATLALSHPPTNPPEPAILYDLLFSLQGLNSATLPFIGHAAISLPNTLSIRSVSILHVLLEPALLYKNLALFVDTPSGLVGQAFRRAMDEELLKYLLVVSKVDEEVRKELLAEKDLEDFRRDRSLGGVTLKKCVYWLHEPTLILRLMADMADKCKDKSGGQLLNELHGYTAHGDKFVADFAKRMLKQASRPYYELLQQWIYTGEIRDPFSEFFIRRGENSNALWVGKYLLDDTQVPGFMSAHLVQKILQIGKSLDFIRVGCDEGAWVDRHGSELSRPFNYDDADDEMEKAIDLAYSRTVTHLMRILTEKFKLKDRIQALKNYLLLGQGDFIAMLMELLASSLEKPANTLYRHHLTSTLETAIRGSNARYASLEILRSLDARMLELSHGETGWDVFTLEYKVESPLDVIVNPYATRQYLKIFNFLWRLKRVAFALDVAWRRSITGARGVLLTVKDLGPDWKTARTCCAEMIHFICQLEYYILYEVIESSWSELQEKLAKTDLTLDRLIEIHSTYLARITHKGLLGSSRTGREDSLIHQLHEILKLVLSFTGVMDVLYNYSVEECSRQQTNENSIVEHATSSVPVQIRARVISLKSKFHALIENFLCDLSFQSDADMRFLGIRLNFNEFYTVPKRRREKRYLTTPSES